MLRVVGSGFSEGVTVLLAGRECLNPTVESPNEIRCITSEGLPGTIPVSVERIDDGQRETAERSDAYTYFEPVKITAVEPTRVPARGGIRITVRGDGLVEGSRVTIDGQQVRDIEIDVDDKSISFVAPPHAPGNVDVGVTNFNGDSIAPGAIVYYEDLVIEGSSRPSVQLLAALRSNCMGVVSSRKVWSVSYRISLEWVRQMTNALRSMSKPRRALLVR